MKLHVCFANSVLIANMANNYAFKLHKLIFKNLIILPCSGHRVLIIQHCPQRSINPDFENCFLPHMMHQSHLERIKQEIGARDCVRCLLVGCVPPTCLYSVPCSLCICFKTSFCQSSRAEKAAAGNVCFCTSAHLTDIFSFRQCASVHCITTLGAKFHQRSGILVSITFLAPSHSSHLSDTFKQKILKPHSFLSSPLL